MASPRGDSQCAPAIAPIGAIWHVSKMDQFQEMNQFQDESIGSVKYVTEDRLAQSDESFR
jgi:hypothetical protein